MGRLKPAKESIPDTQKKGAAEYRFRRAFYWDF